MQLRIFTYIAAVSILLCGAFPIAAKERQVLHWSDIETAIDQHPAIQIANDQTAAAGAEEDTFLTAAIFPIFHAVSNTESRWPEWQMLLENVPVRSYEMDRV